MGRSYRAHGFWPAAVMPKEGRLPLRPRNRNPKVVIPGQTQRRLAQPALEILNGAFIDGLPSIVAVASTGPPPWAMN